MKKSFSLFLALLVIAGRLEASALVTTWDESVNGDLSSDPAAPTAVVFSTDTNRVTGTVRNADDVRDYWTFTIAPGQLLTAVILDNYQDVNSGDAGNRGFHSINAGPTSFIPGTDPNDSFLGGDHLDATSIGTNLLLDLESGGLAGTGFTIPLGPGTYSYLVQQTGPEHTAYTLDFVVIPEPTPAILFTAAGGLLVLRRTRKTS